MRAEVAPYPVDAAGALLTLLDDDRPTLWMFTVTQIAFPPSGDANIMAVVERYLESGEGRAGRPGRPWSASPPTTGATWSRSTRPRPRRAPGPAVREHPGCRPEPARCGYAAIRLPRAPRSRSDRVAVAPVSPTVEERTPMSSWPPSSPCRRRSPADTDGIPEGRSRCTSVRRLQPGRGDARAGRPGRDRVSRYAPWAGAREVPARTSTRTSPSYPWRSRPSAAVARSVRVLGRESTAAATPGRSRPPGCGMLGVAPRRTPLAGCDWSRCRPARARAPGAVRRAVAGVVTRSGLVDAVSRTSPGAVPGPTGAATPP